MTVISKVIYKCDEVQGVMPGFNTYRTVNVKMN